MEEEEGAPGFARDRALNSAPFYLALDFECHRLLARVVQGHGGATGRRRGPDAAGEQGQAGQGGRGEADGAAAGRLGTHFFFGLVLLVRGLGGRGFGLSRRVERVNGQRECCGGARERVCGCAEVPRAAKRAGRGGALARFGRMRSSILSPSTAERAGGGQGDPGWVAWECERAGESAFPPVSSRVKGSGSEEEKRRAALSLRRKRGARRFNRFGRPLFLSDAPRQEKATATSATSVVLRDETQQRLLSSTLPNRCVGRVCVCGAPRRRRDKGRALARANHSRRTPRRSPTPLQTPRRLGLLTQATPARCQKGARLDAIRVRAHVFFVGARAGSPPRLEECGQRPRPGARFPPPADPTFHSSGEPSSWTRQTARVQRKPSPATSSPTPHIELSFSSRQAQPALPLSLRVAPPPLPGPSSWTHTTSGTRLIASSSRSTPAGRVPRLVLASSLFR